MIDLKGFNGFYSSLARFVLSMGSMSVGCGDGQEGCDPRNGPGKAAKFNQTHTIRRAIMLD